MAEYTRATSLDTSASGDTVLEAVVNLSTEVDDIYVDLNAIETAWTAGDAAVTVAYTAAIAAAASQGVMIVRDVKGLNTAAGTFDSGTWYKRTLNSEQYNTISGATLNGESQISLPAGTYIIEASCPAYQVNQHVAKLYNITDAADTLIGTTSQSSAGDATDSRSHICGAFTIATTNAFEIQHKCSSSYSTSGFGYPNNLGVSNVYTVVKITKVA